MGSEGSVQLGIRRRREAANASTCKTLLKSTSAMVALQTATNKSSSFTEVILTSIRKLLERFLTQIPAGDIAISGWTIAAAKGLWFFAEEKAALVRLGKSREEIIAEGYNAYVRSAPPASGGARGSASGDGLLTLDPCHRRSRRSKHCPEAPARCRALIVFPGCRG